MKPALSIVIIGRNEGERLRRCLRSVQEMEPVDGAVEVIYVDSGSTDRSMAVAAEAGAHAIALDHPRPSAARARNTGWQAAAADWILFLDGDTILHPEFPRTALQAVSYASCAVVWGHRRELHSDANWFQRVLDLDWIYRPGETEFCGGDALMRRSALEATGGFDATLIAGEEPELCLRLRRLGYTILHLDAPMTGHDLAITSWKQYWSRAARAGYAYSSMAWRTRNDAMPLWVAEAKANKTRAMVLMSALPVFFALLLVMPVLALTAASLVALMLIRSAWRARWKSADPVSLLLYAMHSHLQQLPIYAGQLAFQRDLARNQHRGLIEYK